MEQLLAINGALTISHHAEEEGREVEFPRPAVRAALISAFCLLHRFVVVVILDRGAPNNLDGRTMSLERGWGLHSPRPIGSLPFVARSPLPAYSPRNNFRRHPPSPAPPPAPALHGIVRRQTILRDPLVRMLLPMSSFQQRSVGSLLHPRGFPRRHVRRERDGSKRGGGGGSPRESSTLLEHVADGFSDPARLARVVHPLPVPPSHGPVLLELHRRFHFSDDISPPTDRLSNDALVFPPRRLVILLLLLLRRRRRPSSSPYDEKETTILGIAQCLLPLPPDVLETLAIRAGVVPADHDRPFV